jgi:hypothetical protein
MDCLGVIIVVLFRRRIDSLIDRIKSTSLTAAGVDLSLDMTQQSLADLAGDLARPDQERVSELNSEAVGTPPESKPDGDWRLEPPDPVRLSQLLAGLERRRRAEIENLVTDAVGYGWDAARTGFYPRQPFPVFEWSEDGNPKILFTTSDPTEAAKRSRYRNNMAG